MSGHLRHGARWPVLLLAGLCGWCLSGLLGSPRADRGEPAPSTVTTRTRAPADLARTATLLGAFFGERLTLQRERGFGWDRVQVRDGGPGEPRRVLRVRYPAGSASPTLTRETGAPGGGAQAYLRLGEGMLQEAWLSYRVRFPADFRFVRGGKLPGLYSGRATSGGHIPEGDDGFSTRLMWRDDGAGEVYAYLPTSSEHGTSLGRGDWTWPRDRWVRVVQRLRLNDVGTSDGVVEIWIDGTRVAHHEGLLLRTSPRVRVEGVFFSTFFGGSDPSWATPVDQSAEFADFEVGSAAL